MRVCLTGATGFVGQAVADELRRRGHTVVGLARSDASATLLRKAGHSVHRGSIDNADSVTPILREVDAVIHTAFNHDFAHYAENCAADGRFLDALARALVGTDTPLVATSVTIVAPSDDLATEADAAQDAVPRSASEAFLRFADQGVRTSVVRLPPTVHGAGDTAFIPALIDLARQTGVSGFIGTGLNRWPAVHRDDAARLFCDAVEQARPGARYHAVAETGLSFRTLAEVIGHGLDVPVGTIPADAAASHFGWLAPFAALDAPASSEETRRATGWTPREIGLIESLHNDGYFA